MTSSHGDSSWCEQTSLARVHVIHAFTAPAAHVATPHKLALAALHVPLHPGVVATAAAQQAATVRPGGRAVAAAPLCASDAPPPVLHAVVGRFVYVDQLGLVYGPGQLLSS